jgi:hypothetical protein
MAVCPDGHSCAYDDLLADLVARLAPELRADVRAGVLDDIRNEARQELHPPLHDELARIAAQADEQLAAIGERTIEQARDVIAGRLRHDPQVWRELLALDRDRPRWRDLFRAALRARTQPEPRRHPWTF